MLFDFFTQPVRPLKHARALTSLRSVLTVAVLVAASVLAAVTAVVVFSGAALAKDFFSSGATPTKAGDFKIILAADLPKEGRDTLALIRKGGPYPYPKDGVIFGNREKALPKQARGFYHEYTVKTPGARNRGARRIVCGGNNQTTAECFYTDDHYETFRKIKE